MFLEERCVVASAAEEVRLCADDIGELLIFDVDDVFVCAGFYSCRESLRMLQNLASVMLEVGDAAFERIAQDGEDREVTAARHVHQVEAVMNRVVTPKRS